MVFSLPRACIEGFYLLVSVQFFLQSIEEGRAASKSPRLVYFLSMSQQAVSTDIIPISAVGIFSQKQKEQRGNQLWY
jgi:hypothetical protein